MFAAYCDGRHGRTMTTCDAWRLTVKVPDVRRGYWPVAMHIRSFCVLCMICQASSCSICFRNSFFPQPAFLKDHKSSWYDMTYDKIICIENTSATSGWNAMIKHCIASQRWYAVNKNNMMWNAVNINDFWTRARYPFIQIINLKNTLKHIKTLSKTTKQIHLHVYGLLVPAHLGVRSTDAVESSRLALWYITAFVQKYHQQ